MDFTTAFPVAVYGSGCKTVCKIGKRKNRKFFYQAKKGGDRRERDKRKWEEGTENDGRMAKKTIPVGYSVQSARYCRASEVHEESTSIKPSSSGVCWWDAPGFSP